MKSNHKRILLLVLSSLIKTLLVASFVLLFSWSLVQVANWKNRKPPVTALADGNLILKADDASIQGMGAAKANLYAGKRNIGWWDNSSQWLEWQVNVDQTGIYRVMLEYALPSNMETELNLLVADQALAITASTSGGWDKWAELDLGEIKLTKGKNQTFTLKPAGQGVTTGIMNFVQLRFEPSIPE